MNSVFAIPAQNLCCFLVLLFSSVMDLKHRRIPNSVTIPALIGGILFHTVPAVGGKGMTFALAGGLAGILVALVPYAMGGMGGGDVKLITAAGAWMGIEGLVGLLIFAAMAGGVMALAMVFRGAPLHLGRLRQDALALMAGRISYKPPSTGMPYSLPISLGFIFSQCFGLPL